MEPNLIFAEINESRKKLGWSKAKARRFFGVSKQTYWRWERGESHPKARHLRKIKKAVECLDVVEKLREKAARKEGLTELEACLYQFLLYFLNQEN